MNGAGHTPGPWSVGDGYDGTYGFVYCNNSLGSAVAIVHSHKALQYTVFSKAEEEANAHLIAAAPELLEAAKLALRIAESGIRDEYDGTSMVDDMLAELEPARAAIAKAEGRT